MNVEKVGRNELCPCGSGKKYKQCHGDQTTQQRQSGGRWIAIVLGGILLMGALGFLNALSNRDAEDAAGTTRGVGQEWSAEHGHYH